VLNIGIVLPNESDIYVFDVAFDLLVISVEMKCRLYNFGVFISKHSSRVCHCIAFVPSYITLNTNQHICVIELWQTDVIVL